MEKYGRLNALGMKYGYGRVPNVERLGKQDKAEFLGGDKSSYGRHYYADYQKVLKSEGYLEMGSDFKILEIGILEGRSFATLYDYFPQAQIDGMDISLKFLNLDLLQKEFGAFGGVGGDLSRMKFFEGDSTLGEEEVRKLGLPSDGYHFILDDGDHHWESQMATWDVFFFNYLKPGGVYLIEDCFQNEIIVHFCRIMIDVLATPTRSISRPENMEKWLKAQGEAGNKYIRYIESIEISRSRITIKKRDF